MATKQTTQPFFWHSTALSDDPQVMKLTRQYGNAGYAGVLYVMEALTGAEDHLLHQDAVLRVLSAGDIEGPLQFLNDLQDLKLVERNPAGMISTEFVKFGDQYPESPRDLMS